VLRTLLLVFSVLLFCVGVVLALALPNESKIVAFEPGVGGLVILAGVLLEQRYRKRVDRSRTTWKATGERFKDPGTGKLVEVFYDPTTGERDYRDVTAP
jgi:hypothetical protein